MRLGHIQVFGMSQKSFVVEKIILFVVFVIFAVIIIALSFYMNGTPVKPALQSEPYQFVTSSKAKYSVPAESDAAASMDESAPTVGSEQAETDGKININTATAEELTKLPGIGEKKAEAIVEYRNLHGAFASTDELLNISGIGEATYEKFKDKVTVK